jgi:hypothetical protein
MRKVQRNNMAEHGWLSIGKTGALAVSVKQPAVTDVGI